MMNKIFPPPRYTHETIAMGYSIIEELAWFRDWVRTPPPNRPRESVRNRHEIFPDQVFPQDDLYDPNLSCTRGVWTW